MSLHAAVAGLAVVGAFCGSVIMSGQGAPPPARKPRPGVDTPGVKIPASMLEPIATFDIPGAPDWMVMDDHVWISNAPKDNVTRIDPKTNTIVENIPTGKRPCSGLAAGFGSIWVPNCGDKTVARIDLKTGKVTATFPMTIGSSEGGVAVGAGSFWMMTDNKGSLVRIDPTTNAVIATIQVAPGSFAAAFSDDAVWITSNEQSVLTRVNAKTNAVEATIPVGQKPRFLAIGEGSVWTLNQGDGTISRVDAKTNKLLATIEAGLPGGGGEISVGAGAVWVTMMEIPLTRIDVATNTVVQQFVGKGGDSVRFGHGSVWLSDLEGGKLLRLDPAKITATTAPKSPQ
jgi:YVTN family beta-propeller protein